MKIKIKSLKILLKKENIDCDSIYFKNRLLRATNWLKEYGNNKTKLLEEFNQEHYKTLTDQEKDWLNDTIEILKENFETTDELQGELYAVVKKETNDSKEIKKLQKRYFQILYNMLLGKDNGPKMGLFLSAVDYDNISKRLTNSNDNIKIRHR